MAVLAKACTKQATFSSQWDAQQHATLFWQQTVRETDICPTFGTTWAVLAAQEACAGHPVCSLPDASEEICNILHPVQRMKVKRVKQHRLHTNLRDALDYEIMTNTDSRKIRYH